MKKVLVTGVAGFIANKVAEILLNQGIEVVGIDNMNDYYDVRLKEFRLSRIENNKNFTFTRTDIEDKQAIEYVFKNHNFDVVFNLAARAGVKYSMDNPYVYMSTNAIGTLNLLEECKKNQVKKLVLASTSSLYAGQEMPFIESLPVNTPISPYAASKKAAELMAYTYHYLYGIDISVVRYFTVFGPCGRPDMSIFRFIQWIQKNQKIELFGDGTQSRDFTFVEDIAHGTILAGKKIGYEIINLGGGKNPITLNTVISKIEAALGKKAHLNQEAFHKTDIRATWADISKAEKLLGWKPKISFESGMEQTIRWHIENQEWLAHIKM